MKRTMTLTSIMLFGVAVMLPTSRILADDEEEAKGVRYHVVDLGRLPGHPPLSSFGTYGNGINNRGEIVGADYFSFQNNTISAPVAFLYRHDHIQSIGTLGGFVSVAKAINEAGLVVGSATIASDPYFTRHAFIYNGTMKDLGTLGGVTSDALSINNEGEVVGLSQTSNGNYEAFLYAGGLMKGLGTLAGMSSSQANGINKRGFIVGVSGNGMPGPCPGSIMHAFFYDGTMHDLGTLGGPQSFAQAINSRDIIVGSSSLSNCATHAFLFDGVMHDLGAFQNGSSYALGINMKNEVVGGWFAQTGNTQTLGAFLYKDGILEDLQTLVDASGGEWSNFIQATGINERGQIVGSGTKQDGVHAFRLDPLRSRDD